MLGFAQVIESLETLAPSARPVFLLHDAILIDIKKDEIEAAASIQHVKVRGYVQKFVLKMEQIN